MNTTSHISPIATRLVAPSKNRAAFAGAFMELDPEIRDLVRIARLAQLQLHQAIGELHHDADGNYDEYPDKEATELATFVVDQAAAMTRRFEELYDRLFSDARG